jgi:DNA-directed RNA polymerase subunit RPC12/RpoP
MKQTIDAGGSMPTYQFRFRCRRCSEAIVLTMRVDAYDRSKREGIECPRCHGADVDREAPTFSVKKTTRRHPAPRSRREGRRNPSTHVN